MPSLASVLAARLWATPPRARMRHEQQAWLAQADRLQVHAAGTRVAVYAWGEGPVVLLVHGWGGHAGQLTGFVPGLVETGHRVVAFDGPRHGATPGGRPSLLSFAEMAQAIAATVGGVRAIIAHSMGASAAAFAMSRGLSADRAVFLAPAATMTGAAERFGQRLGLDSRALQRMRQTFERKLDISWEELDVVPAAHRMRSALLVVHDEGDRDVPHADGDAIARAWPSATLFTTTGLGHHRLLWDPEVVQRSMEFVAEGRALA